MKRLPCQSAAAVLLLVSGKPVLASGEVAAPAEFAEVRRFIQEGIDNRQAPSMAVAVVKDDLIIWAEGFGYADLERKTPATPDSIYLLASVSKPITATGLMILKDRGLVELDAPANRYLRGAKLRAYVGDAEEMTLRRIANHTAGLPLHYSFFYNGVAPHSMDEAIGRYGFAATRPGSEWNYSNLGFGILQYITEIQSGMPWRDFMEKNLYDPLKMTRTSDRVRPGFEADATRRYTLDVAGRFVPVSLYGFDHDGASAIWTSANDLARFARMHLNEGALDGARILKPESVREMQRKTSDRSSTIGTGVSWFLDEFHGRACVSHSGGMPGVSTRLRIFPRDGAAVITLTNSDHSPFRERVVHRIAGVLFPDRPETEPAETPEPAVPDADPAQFAGRWEGRLVHFDGDVPVMLNIEKGGKAAVKLGTAGEAELKNASFKAGRFTGSIEGALRTQPSHHGPVKLEFRLRRDGDQLAGVAVALAEDYFALSHWVELKRKQ